jgi:hypothetical protein
MSRDASESFVPVDWWPLRIVGACQYRILRSPPAPRAMGAVEAEPDGAGLELGVCVQAASAIDAVTARASPLRK